MAKEIVASITHVAIGIAHSMAETLLVLFFDYTVIKLYIVNCTLYTIRFIVL